MFDVDELMKGLKKDFRKTVEAQEIELTCDCGYKLKERIGRLNKNPKFSCPSCKALITVNADKMRKTIESIDK